MQKFQIKLAEGLYVKAAWTVERIQQSWSSCDIYTINTKYNSGIQDEFQDNLKLRNKYGSHSNPIFSSSRSFAGLPTRNTN